MTEALEAVRLEMFLLSCYNVYLYLKEIRKKIIKIDSYIIERDLI